MRKWNSAKKHNNRTRTTSSNITIKETYEQRIKPENAIAQMKKKRIHKIEQKIEDRRGRHSGRKEAKDKERKRLQQNTEFFFCEIKKSFKAKQRNGNSKRARTREAETSVRAGRIKL